MKITTRTSLLASLLLAALATSAPAMKIQIDPPGSATVDYSVSPSGVIGSTSNTTIINANVNESVFLVVTPAAGYDLISAKFKRAELFAPTSLIPFTASVGPIAKLPVTFAVKTKQQNPVGTFGLGSNSTNGTSSSAVRVPTGPVVRNLNGRNIDGDIAIDDAGKAVASGKVDGVLQPDGNSTFSARGSVKKKNDENVATFRGSQPKATMDGLPAGGSGDGEAILDPDGSNEIPVVGKASGTREESGPDGLQRVKYVEPKTETSTPIDPATELAANWQVELSFQEVLSPTGKPVVEATAVLTRPDGERVRMGPRKTVNSPKGYSVRFSNGTKIDSNGDPILNPDGEPILDRKSSLSLKGMKLSNNGSAWVPTGEGTAEGRMLGQKFSGPLSDLLN